MKTAKYGSGSARNKSKKTGKATRRGGSKPETEEADSGEPSLVVEGWGLLLLSAVLVTFIALVSEFVSPGSNLLGPYLGNLWAGALNRFAGSLPALFLLAATALFGIKLVRAKGGMPLRLVWALALLFLATATLLSIRHIGKQTLSDAQFQSSGGYLGNFLVDTVYLPVFGVSRFGPYLVTLISLLIITVWGFRLSMVALSEKAATSLVHVLRPLYRGIAKLWLSRGHAGGVEETFEDYSVPPGAARSALLGARAAAKQTPKPSPRPEGPPRKDSASKEEEFGAYPSPAHGLETVDPPSRKTASLAKRKPQDDHEPARESAEEEFDEIDLNDPLAVRKIRDLDLERKRVSELNEWEIKARNPEIAGMLLREREKAKAKQPLQEEFDLEAKGLGNSEAEAEGPEAPGGKLANLGKERKRGGRKAGTELPAVKESGLGEEEEAALSALRSVGGGAAPPVPAKPQVQYDPYVIPGLDGIFEEPPKQPLEFTEEELRVQSKLLEDQLINFKVMGKVVQICPGPVITRYEVELAPGVKVSRIATLADDLALALKAKSIRILAPIPGKSVVGIEVPNRKAQIVYIKEILRAPEFASEDETLKICLGKNIAGEPYVMDLTRAPHLLIAGQTGSGKSVCINSIMASFLCSKSPDDLRMILVDPKVVELKPYDEIPHLLYPVITQPDVAVSALKWATVEMDRRYEVLAQCGVRNIKGFNQKFREHALPESMDEEDKRRMPYIVIIIDELADLMMVAGKEVETNIARIAQKARAIGIHLILATQRPSTNVITGTIKANLPTRIAFQVASQIDARTIMDKMGAEKLLGRGDMLFRPIEFPEPVRLHGCFLDDSQAEKLALAASDQHVNYPQITSFNLEDEAAAEGAESEPRDELFRQAAELVVQVKQASVSLLQRRLGIGYARSGRLVDQLERAGIVGRERGSKPREVLMAPEELQSFLSSGLNDD